MTNSNTMTISEILTISPEMIRKNGKVIKSNPPKEGTLAAEVNFPLAELTFEIGGWRVETIFSAEKTDTVIVEPVEYLASSDSKVLTPTSISTSIYANLNYEGKTIKTLTDSVITWIGEGEINIVETLNEFMESFNKEAFSH